MSGSHTTTARRVAAGAIALGLLLGACSSDGDDEAGDPTTTTAAPAADGSTTTAATDGAATSTTAPPETQEAKDEIEATTTVPEATTTVPEATEEVTSDVTTITGFVPEDGSESIDVTIQPGTTFTLTVTPDNGFDVVIAVNGPGQTGNDIDDGLSGDPEQVTLAEGEYVITVSGWLGGSGGYTAELVG